MAVWAGSEKVESVAASGFWGGAGPGWLSDAASEQRGGVREGRVSEPKLLGDPLWTQELHPWKLRICLSQTL